MKLVKARSIENYRDVPEMSGRKRRPAARPGRRALPRAARRQEAAETRPSRSPQAQPPMRPGLRAAQQRGPQGFRPGLRSRQRFAPQREDDAQASLDEEQGVLELEVVSEEEMGRQHARVAPRPYSSPAQLGSNMRIQAAGGYRAGVIELRPGLFLVAEVPMETVRSEFGIAMLAPLVANVALKALENPNTQKALVKATEKGVTALSKQLTRPSQPVNRPLPPQAAPVAWADEDDLAGVFGCEGYPPGQCPCRWRSE